MKLGFNNFALNRIEMNLENYIYLETAHLIRETALADKGLILKYIS